MKIKLNDKEIEVFGGEKLIEAAELNAKHLLLVSVADSATGQ